MVLVSTLTLCGCQGIPSTQIGINPATRQFNVKSPKEIEAVNLDITLPDGSRFHADRLSSKNSPDVIASQAMANALQMEKANQMIDKATKLVESVGIKALTSGVGP